MRCALLAVALLLLSTCAFADGKPNWLVPTGPHIVKMCVGKDVVYYLVYSTGEAYTAFKILTLDGACHDPYSGNGPAPPQTTTPVAGSSGSTGGKAVPHRTATTAAPTGSTAFVPTVPFRRFPLPGPGPAPSQSLSMATCNSGLNPTMFEVFHEQNVVKRESLCTTDVIATINVPSNPLQVQVTPDGRWGIVTSYDNAISFINTDTNTVATTISTTAYASGLAISSDGSFALVTSYIDTNPLLLVLDVPNQAIKGTIQLDAQYPQSVFLSPDATLAWVTYPFSNFVEVIDVMTGSVDATIRVPAAEDIKFNQTGTMAFISSNSPGSVAVVNTTTYAIVQTITTAQGSTELVADPASNFMMVNNFNSDSVSIIDMNSLAVVYTVMLSGTPIGGTLAPIQ